MHTWTAFEEFLGHSIWELSHKAEHDYTAWITGHCVGVSDREMIRKLGSEFPSWKARLFAGIVLQNWTDKVIAVDINPW